MLLALLTISLSGCRARRGLEAQSLTSADIDARILAIADQYAISGDEEMAKAALSELALSNPAQSVLALAESQISSNGEPDMTRNLVSLAGALGPLSRMARDYLADSTGVASAQAVQESLPTPTLVPSTATPTATSVPPTATPTLEPTATATFTPVPVPRVIAESQQVNVRQGPSTAYAVVGQMAQADSAIVLGRNEAGSWWQVILEDGTEGWVVASLVGTDGPMDAVEIAQNVAPPPQPAPVATSAPPAAPAPAPAATATAPPAPEPGTPFRIASLKLRPVGQDAQRCDGGDHNIFVTVVDAAGNPLDGVRVREIYSDQIIATGAQGKGTGRVEYDIYRGGGGVVEIVDENNNPISPQTRGMSADWPAFDLMLEAGYCGCKPHPDPESCRIDLENKGYFFAVGHYVYEVTFQRSN